VTNVYRDDEWFMNRHRPEEMRFFKEAVFNYSLFEPALLEPEGVSKVFFTTDSHERLLPLEQAINARWGDRVNVSFSTLTCLEVMAGGVSKGHALEAVAKAMGYSLKDCIAFGDGMNDAEMLYGGQRLHHGQCPPAPEGSASGAGSHRTQRRRCRAALSARSLLK
jgi:hydroxymethylpyrimidine pyrophosphatase-like HAD family hydrolase